MKKILALLILIPTISFAQETDGNGIVLEYNQKQNSIYESFSPIKIKIVNSQTEIDYSKIEGIVQSFLSANNRQWVKSDFYNKNKTSVKDDEHFNKIKSCNKDSTYVELESVYRYSYNGNSMALVKFSITFEGVPFQIIYSLSIIFRDNRWYIYDLINQTNTTYIFSSLNNNIILELLSKEKSKNNIVEKLKNNSMIQSTLNIDLLFRNIENLKENEKNQLLDERIWNFNAGKNINKKYQNKKIESIILQSFTLDKAVFTTYNKKDILYQGVKVQDTENKKFLSSIIPQTKDTLYLIHSLSIKLNSNNYIVVKYKFKNSIESTIIGENPNKEIIEISNFVKTIKSKVFFDIIANKEISELKDIIKDSKGQVNGLNISNLAYFFLKNKALLSKYIDD
ncbi:hypothetical protein FNW52_15825 [Flavobacterium sp. ZT3R18]|uniref:hypothetical protein n=1 Tax=Flavobacterium sp. ZT3R18 TaxID=2594429 RepID=UPI00117A9C9C|nr:hypothetical protein [Flavobacterium sp. ZT3R18]TRX33226.1 hypothetical protein FNW52_15825 [Flavobacterium sp. ZT3R18]